MCLSSLIIWIKHLLWIQISNFSTAIYTFSVKQVDQTQVNSVIWGGCDLGRGSIYSMIAFGWYVESCNDSTWSYQVGAFSCLCPLICSLNNWFFFSYFIGGCFLCFSPKHDPIDCQKDNAVEEKPANEENVEQAVVPDEENAAAAADPQSPPAEEVKPQVYWECEKWSSFNWVYMLYVFCMKILVWHSFKRKRITK